MSVFTKLTFADDVSWRTDFEQAAAELHTGLSIYRRLVRNNLFTVIKRACPIAIERLGTDGFENIVAVFLSQKELNEPIYWLVPVHFGEWVYLNRQSLVDEDLLIDPSMGELIMWESIEVSVINARAGVTQGKLHTDSQLRVSEGTHIFQFEYDVFRNGRKPSLKKFDAAEIVMAYPKEGRMFWRVLTPAEASVFALLNEGHGLSEIQALFDQNQIALEQDSVLEFCAYALERGWLAFGAPTTGSGASA